jgi:hypothetical protein
VRTTPAGGGGHRLPIAKRAVVVCGGRRDFLATEISEKKSQLGLVCVHLCSVSLGWPHGSQAYVVGGFIGVEPPSVSLLWTSPACVAASPQHAHGACCLPPQDAHDMPTCTPYLGSPWAHGHSLHAHVGAMAVQTEVSCTANGG